MRYAPTSPNHSACGMAGAHGRGIAGHPFGVAVSAEIDVNFAAPVKSVSIENMVRMRAAVLERIVRAAELLDEAARMARAAHVGFPDLKIKNSYRHETPILAPEAPEVVRAEVDRVAWGYLMSESGLRTFMDAEARRKWDEELYKGTVPELTAENIEATFATMHDARGEMFERGVIRCFRRLSWDYRSNNPYRIGKRLVLRHVVSVRPWRDARHSGVSVLPNHGSTDELDDLLRVFHVFDGRPEPDHRQGLQSLLWDSIHAGQWSCENEYFAIRWFKNGNGHLMFKRLDLVEKLNGIIAKHFPGALAHERPRASAERER